MLAWLLTHSPLLYFTQSIWRDEAFSILVAQRPLSFIFTNLGIEPPLYYTVLHFWIKLFGTSEIAVRSFSLLGFTLATILVIFWAEKLFKKHWLSWYLPILFFLNPMLIYYAFEIRTYGWFIFFSVASMYGYVEKKWPILVAANVLGFYNHSYMIFVPITQAIHWLITEFRIKRINNPVIHSLTVTFLLIAPWFFRLAREYTTLKTTWYFPVDVHLVKSALGNMFVGYEGTPWYLWTTTFYLSLVLISFFLLALKPKRVRSRNLFFFSMVIVPLTIVIGISFFKPLFVNRYLIYVSVAEIFLLVFAIETIRHRVIQYGIATVLILFSAGFNLWYPNKHAKVNIRQTFQEVNMLMGKEDIVMAGSPLVLFESIYYAKDPTRVYLYNPQNVAFPHYVGDAIVQPSQMLQEFPFYPSRAFLIREDGSFDITYTTPASIARKTSRRGR